MKITKPEVEALREAIAPLDTEDRRENYRKGMFPRAESVKDIDKRYRWDLAHEAGKGRWSLIAPLYDAGYDDTHIDTALRHIVLPLNARK